MIWNGKYVKIYSIIEKVYRDMGMLDQINFGDALEWAGEAMEFIGTPHQLIDAVEVYHFDCKRLKLPINLHFLLAARALPNVTCKQYEEAKKCGKKFNFYPMRYSTDTMHRYCSDNTDRNHLNCDLTYIVNDDYLIPNFEEGLIQMNFKAIPVDEKGFPLVPDDVKFRNAVAYHIMWKLAFIKLMAGKIPQSAYQIIERDRDWYIGAAQSRGNMPNPDMMESIKNNWIRLIKKINQHSDGFKSAGFPEQRNTVNSLPLESGSITRNSNDPTFFYISKQEN